MSTVIKNGKDHTINIYHTILLSVLALLPFVLSSFTINEPKGRVIVIDAGHGGKDPGALGVISREKDLTLAIALKTGEYIKQNIKDVTVVYTRKDDSTVELRDRPKIANKVNADLFISIHVNWAKSKNVAGAETYIMGYAKDQANLEVAMNENSVMYLEDDYSTKYEGFDPKSTESYIMFSLTQKVFQEQSTDLATMIQKQFRERVNRNDRDVKQAGFWVLYNTKMPSVLVETGFITNLNEERYLNSKEGQDYLASAIYRACRDYLDAIDSRSGISVTREEKPSISPDTEILKADTLPLTITQPVEITYMVQLKTSLTKTLLKPENFKGIKDVIEINAEDRFKYATGNFTDYQDAVNYRKKIEAIYPGAFVIAVKDNKILPLQEALEQKRKNK